jgi:GTP:adenosylcobinamide-phosphate guanylyltransferase
MTLVVMTAGKGSRFGGMKKIARIGPSGEALVVTYADDVAAVRDEIAASSPPAGTRRASGGDGDRL